MGSLSVNATIERLDELAGSDVTVFGQLSLEFEGQCISHLSRAERLPEPETGMYTSSIWTRFDLDAIGQREEWLMQFDGCHVMLRGLLHGPDPIYDGCGHFSLWPAGIVVRAISKA